MLGGIFFGKHFTASDYVITLADFSLVLGLGRLFVFAFSVNFVQSSIH